MTKSITFTIMHFCIAMTVAYLLTGSLVMGGLIALVEPLVNSVGYYFHEKAWDSIQRKKALADTTQPADASAGMAMSA